MRRLRRFARILRILTAVSMMGSVCAFGAGCLEKIGKNFNPCGTIIDCDPVEWDLMFHDYPDWDLDPTCTIPGLCGGQWPPSGDSGAATDTGTD